jgi:hypothetical protein
MNRTEHELALLAEARKDPRRGRAALAKARPLREAEIRKVFGPGVWR